MQGRVLRGIPLEIKPALAGEPTDDFDPLEVGRRLKALALAVRACLNTHCSYVQYRNLACVILLATFL